MAWSESRPLRRTSTPEGVEGAGVDRYTYGTCGRRFVDRPGFEGRHYAEDVTPYAVRLVARNMLPKDAARTIKDEKKVVVSGRTIQRWVDEYPRMVAAFARDLEMTGGNAVSVDEKHYKSRGKPRWMARAICMATRFILASDHWPDKLNHDATPLLKKVVERLGRRGPLLLLSDKLGGYRVGYDSTMRTEPRARHHAHTGCSRQQQARKQQPARAPQRGHREAQEGLAWIQLRRTGAVRTG